MPLRDEVAIFIDGSNLYYGLKATCGRAKLDFNKFIQKLVRLRPLDRVYYYNAPVEQKSDPARYKRQQSFFNSLSHVDYLEVRLGKLVKRTENFHCPNCNQDFKRDLMSQKGVDVRLAIDMVSRARKGTFGTAILVSGDADFTSAVQELKDMGLHVELAYFLRDPQGRTGLSDQLRTAADKFVELTPDFLSDCWLP